MRRNMHTSLILSSQYQQLTLLPTCEGLLRWWQASWGLSGSRMLKIRSLTDGGGVRFKVLKKVFRVCSFGESLKACVMKEGVLMLLRRFRMASQWGFFRRRWNINGQSQLLLLLLIRRSQMVRNVNEKERDLIQVSTWMNDEDEDTNDTRWSSWRVMNLFQVQAGEKRVKAHQKIRPHQPL